MPWSLGGMNNIPCIVFPFLRIILITSLLLCTLIACTGSADSNLEILIGLKPEAIQLLLEPQQPNPLDTGLTSLDLLNEKWDIQAMIPVFSGVDPSDPLARKYGLVGVYKLVFRDDKHLQRILLDYQSDPNISFAEVNQPVEIK